MKFTPERAAALARTYNVNNWPITTTSVAIAAMLNAAVEQATEELLKDRVARAHELEQLRTENERLIDDLLATGKNLQKALT